MDIFTSAAYDFMTGPFMVDNTPANTKQVDILASLIRSFYISGVNTARAKTAEIISAKVLALDAGKEPAFMAEEHYFDLAWKIDKSVQAAADNPETRYVLVDTAPYLVEQKRQSLEREAELFSQAVDREIERRNKLAAAIRVTEEV